MRYLTFPLPQLATNGHIVGTPAVATVTILDTTGKCHNYVMYYCVYMYKVALLY